MPETVVAPRIRGFLCLTSHPDGCAANVRRQIDVQSHHRRGPEDRFGHWLVHRLWACQQPHRCIWLRR